MEEIFKLEYHPVDTAPRRLRILLLPGEDDIHRVTEQLTDGAWEEIDRDRIEYFEYSDE
ncbi:hypothetical protein [Halosimplex sp. TS25]|uniref:hypothetical protein n=1 Tax=Halosimplex rarum TaxID=3396619 RepID=UPI0039E72BF7